MEIEIEETAVPPEAQVSIQVNVTAKLVITNVVAQRKVSRLLLDSVSNLLYGERPHLVAGKRMLWRVPVWLGLPTHGPVGQVGAMDVDVQSGEILYSQTILDEIAERAHALAQRTTSSTT